MKITRKQAIRILTKLIDQDGVDWVLDEMELYDADMYSIMLALGVSKKEVDEGYGIEKSK